ncbi:MAG TPA: GNAT family N-acetyltransferase [Microscillaceae bacterium]|nr:GNAT family N-acetyltransferase [Microscillaceae bacterium]
MKQHIRKVRKQDIPALKVVIDSAKLFPSEMLDEMMSDYFNNPSSQHIWLTQEIDGKPATVVYCAPEYLTEGTYNLYLIAVHAQYQGQGIGREMIQYLEELLREQGQRILLVETSGNAEFELTRKFYLQNNYTQEAIIREFYQKGEDKVVFWKKLS